MKPGKKLFGSINLIIFVETGHQSIGLRHNVAGKLGLRSLQPGGDALTIDGMIDGATLGVEIGVLQIFVVQHTPDDVIVIAKTADGNLAIVALKIVEHPTVPARLHIEEYWINKLHDIVVFQARKQAKELGEIASRT